MRPSSETIGKLENLVTKWLEVETQTIKYAAEYGGKASNPLLKTFFDVIKRDSEKHHEILTAIQENMEHSVTFTPEDMQLVDLFVEIHDKIEKEIIVWGENTIPHTRSPMAKFLLHYMLDDEKKHDMMTQELNKLKSNAMIGT